MISLDPTVVGYRFHPSDEELINYYLKNKIIGNEARVEAIPEVDVLKFEPWDLPDRSVIELRDNEWYFFSKISSINGSRSKRATKLGYWKITGKDREIKVPGSKKTIGIKKTLVFYRRRVSHDAGTNWVIHEYHSPCTFPHQREFVLIKLRRTVDKDKERKSPSNEVEHSNDVSVTSDMTTEINTTPEVQGNGEASLESTFPLRNVDFPSPSYHSEISMHQSQSGDYEQLITEDDINMFIYSFFCDQPKLVQQTVEHNVATKNATAEAQGNGKEPSELSYSNHTPPDYINGINMEPSRSGDKEQQLPKVDETQSFNSFPVDQLEMVQSQDRDNERLPNDDLISVQNTIIGNEDYDEFFNWKDFYQGDDRGKEAAAPPQPLSYHHVTQ